MKHAPLAAITIVIWILMLSPISATTLRTVEEGALRHLATSMSIFKKMHGRLPETWKEIYSFDSSIRRENEAMMTTYGWGIQDRYQFVTHRLPMFQHGDDYDIDESSQVLLCRIIPYKDFRSEGNVRRTFIYEKENGELALSDLPEERAQKLFKAYSITISVPAGLPDVESNAIRPQLEKAGSPPNSADAMRVWPPRPIQPQAPPPRSPSSVAVAPTGSNATHPGAGKTLTVWYSVGIVLLCSGVLLFLRYRKRDGRN